MTSSVPSGDAPDASPATTLLQPTAPLIDEATAQSIAADFWGVSATARSLGSHQDRNFLLTTADGEHLLLKISNPSVTAAELEAQSAAAELIAARAGARAPRARTFADGSTVREVVLDGVTMNARMLQFLVGDTLEGYLSPRMVDEIGALAARVALALNDFTPMDAERIHQWDLRHAPRALEALLPHVDDDAIRTELRDAAELAWAAVAPLVNDLPVQFIHGDLTDDNVVTSDLLSRVPDGVIDLGDLNRTWTVSELAITVSSLLHHEGIDLPSAMRAVAAYHAVRPLRETEAEALWPLVVLRGATLVASAHHVLATDPGNEYAANNLAHERVIFDAAVSVPLLVATTLVRSTIGLPVTPCALPASEIGLLELSAPDVGVADLSPTSPALHEGRWLEASAEEVLFAENLRSHTAVVARFGEHRLTRSRSYATAPPENLALGVELRVTSPQRLIAPWAGRVSSAGGAVWLHCDGLTLRLEGAAIAAPERTRVAAGQVIGIADHRVWVTCARPRHSVPSFTTSGLRDAWRAVVADPSALFLGLAPAAVPEPPHALLERRRQAFADVQEHYFDDPPVFVRGWKEFLVDATARVYLDTLNNVTAVGHAHPRVVAAAHDQWRLLNTNSRFHYPEVVEFSERLAALLPDPLDTVFLVNSGSEAIDLALRLAQAWTGRQDVVAIREAYHGWTYLTDAVSTSVADNPAALETRPAWVHPVAGAPSGRPESGDANALTAAAVAEIARLSDAGTPPGAFIAESVFGNAGGIMLPDGYLDAVYRAVRDAGGLAIADEVQVGYGRLGEWFWGFEQQGVVPDIVGVAKAMGNGYPLGAVITTREIAERYRTGGYFFSSAGGSPVSSAIGLAVLDVIADERLQENAREVGAYLKAGLETLGTKHPIIGAVHGSGLYLGPELVRDREQWTPATQETAAICNRLRELGVIAQPTGDHQNILKIKPPMCFTRESADALIDALDRALTTGW